MSAPVDLGGLPVAVQPGPATLRCAWVGGASPAVTRAELRAELVGPSGAAHQLILATDGAWLDGHRLCDAPLPLAAPFAPWLDALADAQLTASGHPVGELALRFPAGVQVLVPAEERVSVAAAAVGPASALALADALEVSFHGAGIRVSHRRLRWLADAVQVSVSSARLLPSGAVTLSGGARHGLGRLVQGGLDVAGEQLAELVRTAPQFARVRAFLPG